MSLRVFASTQIAMFKNKFSLYVLAHGIIQHDAYHAGQIALLKNASA